MHFIYSNNSFVNVKMVDLTRSNFFRGGGGIVENMDLF